jgi:hypothetical protein
MSVSEVSLNWVKYLNLKPDVAVRLADLAIALGIVPEDFLSTTCFAFARMGVTGFEVNNIMYTKFDGDYTVMVACDVAALITDALRKEDLRSAMEELSGVTSWLLKENETFWAEVKHRDDYAYIGEIYNKPFLDFDFSARVGGNRDSRPSYRPLDILDLKSRGLVPENGQISRRTDRYYWPLWMQNPRNINYFDTHTGSPYSTGGVYCFDRLYKIPDYTGYNPGCVNYPPHQQWRGFKAEPWLGFK